MEKSINNDVENDMPHSESCSGVDFNTSNIRVCSYSFLFAWFLSLVCSPVLPAFFQPSTSFDPRMLLFLGMFASFMICKYLLKFCLDHVGLLKGFVIAASCFFIAAITLALVRVPYFEYVSWGMLGTCTALLFVLWDYYSVSCGQFKTTSYSFVGKATAISGFVVLVINCMHMHYALIATLCLFPLSLLFVTFFLYKTPCRESIFSADYVNKTAVVKPQKMEYSRQALLYVFGYGLIFGYFITSFYRLELFAEPAALIAAAAVLVSGVAISFFETKGVTVRFCGELVRWFLPSGVLLLFSFSSLMAAFPVVQLVAFAVLMIVLTSYAKTRTAYLIKLERPECFASVSSFLAARLIASVGFIVGLSISMIGLQQVEYELAGTLLLAMVFVVIAVSGVGKYAFSLQKDYLEQLDFEASTSGENTASLPQTVQNLYQTTCEKFAAHYALTGRETDILYHLGKGRNAHFMQEKLFISEHTAKTHIYNIYQKVDVHSQQELMSMLDEWYNDEKGA